MQAGLAEGRDLGLQKGWEIGQEVGFYAGCVQVHVITAVDIMLSLLLTACSFCNMPGTHPNMQRLWRRSGANCNKRIQQHFHKELTKG